MDSPDTFVSLEPFRPISWDQHGSSAAEAAFQMPL